MNAVFGILAGLMPLVLALKMRSTTLAICLSMLWFWGWMIAAAHYRATWNSEPTRFSPALSIIGGWLPGLIYAFLCVLLVTLTKHVIEFIRSRSR